MLAKDPRFLFTFIIGFFLIVMAIVGAKSQSFRSGRTGQDAAVMEIIREQKVASSSNQQK